MKQAIVTECHPNESKISSKTSNASNELRSTYAGEFCHLIFGAFPAEDKIYHNPERIKECLISAN